MYGLFECMSSGWVAQKCDHAKQETQPIVKLTLQTLLHVQTQMQTQVVVIHHQLTQYKYIHK